MDKATQDYIASEMAKVTELVQNHKSDKASLDTDALAEVVKGLVDTQVAAELAKSAADKPVRKGEIIGPAGFESVSKGVAVSGKYAGKSIEDLEFVYWMLEKGRAVYPQSVKPASKDLLDTLSKAGVLNINTKALTATGSGTGDEFVPTGMSSALWTDMFLAAKVVPTIGITPMPTDPFDMPFGWGALTWRKGTQNTATTVTDPATGKSTFTATEQVAEINWAYDLDEDSIIAVLPTLRAEIARDAAEQMDRFALNADSTNAGTGNINLNDADPADDSYYLSLGQDGIRHLYLVDNTGQSTDANTTLTDAIVRAAIGRLGKYAIDVSRLAMVTDAKTYVNGMLGLTNVVTIDKFGPQATVLTGQLASYSGIPVIPSGALLQAGDDGFQVASGASNDEGQIAIFHRDMWRVGFRRQLLIELDRNIQKRQFVLVVSFRQAMAARGTRSTAVHTAAVHGIVRA